MGEQPLRNSWSRSPALIIKEGWLFKRGTKSKIGFLILFCNNIANIS